MDRSWSNYHGGVHIGNGAVIGAEAVVAKDIPPYAVVVGNPAKVIRYRFRPEIIAKLQRIKWWYWPEHKLAMVKEYADDIEGFVHRFYDETGLSQGVLETEESEQLAGLKQSGYTIMYLTLKKEKELSEQSKRVLQQYFEHYAIHDKVALVLEIPAGHRGKRINMAIDTFLKEYSADTMPLLITHDAKLMEDVPEAILSHIDYLITTKEQFMLKYADYAMEYGAKTLYGIGKRIFGAIVLPDREA